jgi:uncharacterized protein YkwD
LKTAALLGSVLVCAAAACAAARGLDPVRSADRSLAARLVAQARLLHAHGCAGRLGLATPLRLRRRLNLAARELASGRDLGTATRQSGYGARLATDIHLSGDLSPSSIEELLASRFCSQLTDPALSDIGVHAQGSDAWIIMAAPFATAALAHPAGVERRVLSLVNAARSAGRRCGARWFGPAPPLRSSTTLEIAALAHARDMAEHDYFGHVGRDGSAPADRVTRAGFEWSAVGENIAWGQTSARAVVRAWLSSPEHCANIMDRAFTATAVAFSVDPRSSSGVYWTEEFARPLRARRGR